jgi:hypothetical protein
MCPTDDGVAGGPRRLAADLASRVQRPIHRSWLVADPDGTADAARGRDGAPPTPLVPETGGLTTVADEKAAAGLLWPTVVDSASGRRASAYRFLS